MKIFHKEAGLIITSVLHANQNDIKKLSQKDREICSIALVCLSSNQDTGFDVNCSSLDCAITDIKSSLDSAPSLFFVELISSLVKGILNLFNLRITSENIYQRLKEYWEQYLQENCTITSNCDLKNAKIIFIGDHHADFYQGTIRQNLVDHYTEVSKENFIFVEALDPHDGPSPKRGIFTKESWEQKEHYEDAKLITDEICASNKQFEEKRHAYEYYKSVKDVGKAKIIWKEIEPLMEHLKILFKESNRLQKVRDADLLAKVKTCVSQNTHAKIFVTAGTSHLTGILDFFNEVPAALIVPKISAIGILNAKRVIENTLKLGSYSQAYN